MELDPWANALLGAWHMTVSHHAGPVLARLAFDTSWNERIDRAQTALETDPGNVAVVINALRRSVGGSNWLGGVSLSEISG